MSNDPDSILEMEGISKAFPGVQALDKVKLTLRKGKLTALLGENGAGKSTLMSILAGILRPDEGVIRLNGEEVEFPNARAAQAHGISMIFQELNLMANLTVAENIFLGREPLNRLGLIDYPRMNRDAALLLKKLELDALPTTPLGDLRVGEQQIVEIAKALSTDARIIIMDEPTSAISDHEVEVLFRVIRELKENGIAIAYITHKLNELTTIGDDAVVMRDGHWIGEGSLAELSHDEIVQMMVGRDLKDLYRKSPKEQGEELFRVEGLTLGNPKKPDTPVLENISFSLCRGEVLGIFGLMGAGRTELMECIFGLHARNVTGKIFIDGKLQTINSPADAIAAGLALAPEDRKREGLILEMTVAENTSLPSLARLEKYGFLDTKMERRHVEDSIERFNVKTPSIHQMVRNLSGGNQQKVILGKWLATDPVIVLLDEPTRGIDINAKKEIYTLVDELARDGLSVIMVSSELPEIMAVADRILVLSEGRMTGEFAGDEIKEDALMKAALPQDRRTQVNQS